MKKNKIIICIFLFLILSNYVFVWFFCTPESSVPSPARFNGDTLASSRTAVRPRTLVYLVATCSSAKINNFVDWNKDKSSLI